MRSAVALALTCLLACAHVQSPASSGEPADPRSSLAAPERGSALEPYGTTARAGGVRGNAVDDDLARLVTKACEANGLALDGRLAELAESVARTSHGATRAPSYATVSFYARLAGIVEPTPEVWLASAPDTTSLSDALIGAIQEASRGSRLNRCGAAALRQGKSIVVGLAMSGRFLELDQEIPQRVEPGERLRIVGSLASGMSKPMLAVTAPDGKVTRDALKKGRKIDHALELKDRGEYTVELLGEGAQGVAVLAMFKVAVGVDPSLRAPADDDSPGEATAEEVAQNLTDLVAAERKRRGLSPLTVDARVAAVARAHSEDMVAHHFIAHTSPTTGSATDRVQRAGLRATVVLENIGRGYSAQEIHEGLMESPGHRGNVLHPDPKQIGIGVVAEREGDRLAFIATELYTKLAGDVDPKKAVEQIASEVARRRSAAHAPRASLDANLSRIAQRAAERYAAGEERREAQLLDQATREVREPPKGVRAVVAALVLADDLEQVWDNPRLLDPEAMALGLGLAKLKSAEPHQFCLVIMLGLKK